MSFLVLHALWDVYKKQSDYESEKNMQNDAIIQIANAFEEDSKNQEFGWSAGYRIPGDSTQDNIYRLNGVEKRDIDNIILPQLTFEDSKNDTKGGGCGSIMHAAPFGYFKNFFKIAGQHSRITHNHPIAITSCISLATGIDMMIYGDKTNNKDEIIDEMISTADTEEWDAISKEDSDENRYEYRMKIILKAAVTAADEMKQIREDCAKDYFKAKHISEYLIPFHWLMKNNENFKRRHIAMFPYKQWEVDSYDYDQSLFSGWDAATCLAIAMYNFSLYIPEDINEENRYSDEDKKRCVINAITSAMVISGDSDSAAAVTGQLIGAYIKSPLIFENLTKIIEDSEKMMKLIKGEEVNLFDHSGKTITDSTWWSDNKTYVYSGIGIFSFGFASWLLWTKFLRPNYFVKKS